MDKKIRGDLANGIRDAVKLAEDATDVGGMLVEQGTGATARLGSGLVKGIVGIPSSLARKVADAIDDTEA